MGQGLCKALFLLPQDRLDGFACRSQLWVSLAHFLIECIDQRMKKQALRAQLMAVAHGASSNPAQHIAAPFVAGDHAVNDQERTGADMVRDHPQARRCQIGGPSGLPCCCDQGLEKINFVIGMNMLKHRCKTFEAHSGIDAGPGQRRQSARGVPLVLHEHKVPDLDITITVFIR